jgi:rhamnulokinase
MRLVSVDLGAQSGRVAVGSFDGRRLGVTEVNRFPNIPVRVHDRLHWDPLRLFDGILEGLRAAARESGPPITSVAVDGWGVDFALLDRAGRLLGNPAHYRDKRTEGAVREVSERIPERRLFGCTGTQRMPINTIYQLWAMVSARDPVLEAAAKLLLIPDLFHYWLSGVPRCELTEASTTQCYDPGAGDWAWGLLGELGIPHHLFGEVVAPGTLLGNLRPEVAEATGLAGAVVISPASHDTASAVAAVPFRQPGSAYLSSGTWSVVGMELPRPLINDAAFKANLTNEAGPGGTFELGKNLTGLWLVEECRRTWERLGQAWDSAGLASMAEPLPPLASLVDPDDPVFAVPGDMPGRIREWCRRTAQTVPDGPGEVVRCVLESLALAYRQAVELLAAACAASPPALHIVGGGSRNGLLCQWTADATGLPVWAGPTEASEVGNLLVQLIALGELATLGDARAVVAESFPPVLYEPQGNGRWEEAYARFEKLTHQRATA